MPDAFDDFEFKPLTEGLGFHKKAEKLKSDVRATYAEPAKTVKPVVEVEPFPVPVSSKEQPRPASQSISDLIASLPPSLDFADDAPAVAPTPRPQIFQPLAPPRTAAVSHPPGPTIGSVLPTPGTHAGGPIAAATVPAPTLSSPYQSQLKESFAKAFPHAEARGSRATSSAASRPETESAPAKAVIHNMPGAILDAMVALGLSTIFLVCILAVTKVNLVGLLTNANTDVATRFHLVLLFVAVLQMYMLTARSFFGASLGEWAFDLELGTEEQRAKALYPLQAAWRTLLMTFTGFVVIPLLSLVFRRDLARPLTGLELIHRP